MTEVIYVFQRNEDLSVCALGMSFVHRERRGFFLLLFLKREEQRGKEQAVFGMI